jgi:alginate O-acetyltransferase complex protein AlgI
MLFNSYQFIFLYLPIVFLVFFGIALRSFRMASLWLAVASVFFYGYWNPKFVLLLIASIVFNYSVGYWIDHARYQSKSKSLLSLAIVVNLLFLGLFKYANFFIASANLLNAQMGLLDIVLPLGISFFTFTQIAYLIDVYRGVPHVYNFTHYLLFVTWFPHLIAGPVLNHRQMIPQFSSIETYKINFESISVGLTLFSLGLFKKIVIADQFALYANPVFESVSDGAQPMLFEAWVGALAYSLQLYFDFSGYSDMAIGLSRLFNIKLPLNFNSPYQATSIIDFWRRWHITLSAFLREYLYIPLGGNQKGTIRRYANLMVTMILGGLWHGAGLNFILWGGLHGIYLVINHGWKNLSTRLSFAKGPKYHLICVLLTFVCVVFAWVPFRSENFGVTQSMIFGMIGMNGVSIHPRIFSFLGVESSSFILNGFFPLTGMPLKNVALWIASGLMLVWFFPNTQQLMVNFSPAWDVVNKSSWLKWKPTRLIAIMLGTLFGFSLLCLNRVSEFLYFQF